MANFSDAEREVIEELNRDLKVAKKVRPPQGRPVRGGQLSPVEALLKEHGLEKGRLG